MTSLYIHKLKISVKLQENILARWDISVRHVPILSFVNLHSQSLVFNVLISCHGRFKATEKIESRHVLKLLKLINSRARYQNSSFFWVGWLYFQHDVYSCAMVLLIIPLSKTRIKVTYVNIRYVYVIEFTLAELTLMQRCRF